MRSAWTLENNSVVRHVTNSYLLKYLYKTNFDILKKSDKKVLSAKRAWGDKFSCEALEARDASIKF